MKGMINAKQLFDRFLGAGGASPDGQAQASPWGQQGAMPTPPGGGGAPSGGAGGFLGQAKDALNGMGGVGGFAGGAAAGGLLGMLLGGKAKRLGGGLLTHGGAAALGALAHHGYQKWQANQANQATGAAPPAYVPPAAPASPAALPAPAEDFELSLIRAMIGAAKVDGHIDAQEQARIFEQVEKAGLDAEAKGFVFDALHRPVGLSEIAAAATTPERASQLYLVSRLALDPDQPAERSYLEALAHRLKLPPGLTAELEREIVSLAPQSA